MRTVPLVLLLAFVQPVVAATVATVFGGRLPCTERDGVQFCEGSLAVRTESWDGVPLDANVTLPPASMEGPFPLIVELHGWSAAKTGTPFTSRAERGYVVLSYTARGFHTSCGSLDARQPDATLTNPNVCAERGWIHLADARYEARDTQWLAGLLADDGLVIPDKVGVTGVSYGGGQSMILAALQSRILQPDGTLAAWTSPQGKPMAIAAAAPVVPWTSLAEALTPAGRTLDYRIDNPYGSRAGIQKSSWNATLYGAGVATGHFSAPGVDPSCDIVSWNARVGAGEPYDGDSAVGAITDEVARYHSAYGIDDAVPPAPLYIYNAWTDDLFPADETIRFWRRTRDRHPTAEIALAYEDGFGHPRASLAASNIGRVFGAIERFFDGKLLGLPVDPPPAVEAYTQGCNGVAPEGPFVAPDWDALHPGEVRFVTAKVRRFDQRGGNPDTAKALDPLNGGPCRTIAAATDPGAATYLFPAAKDAGYTLLGAPTVIADLLASGSYPQIAARLWDVGPDDQQTLVSQSLYRPRSDALGPQPFQLHPNGWRFAAGHRPKLELLAESAPFGHAATGEFVVTVRRLELRLPVRETPSGIVRTPATPVLPPTAIEPSDSGVPACPAAPAATCTGGERAQLDWNPGAAPAAAKLAWRWKGAATSFGDPSTSTAYRLCVYDGSTLVAQAAVPNGGSCGTAARSRACWKVTTKQSTYADARSTPDGVHRFVARTLRGAKGALLLQANGARLTLPTTMPTAPRVQLISNRGACWGNEP